jgi:hypothetical protein
MKNVHQTMSVAVCFLIAGAGGYCLQALHDRPVSALTGSKTAGVDYFLTARSFSEVDNARAFMEALAVRSLQELRTRRIATGRPAADPPALSPAREQQVAQLVQDCFSAIRQFEGTGQEMLFVQDLLGLFRREGQHQEWVRLYLDVLYRHPTHEMIARLAGEALIIGKKAQREQDILDALNHLRGIPPEFDVKPLIEAALARTASSLYLTQSEPVAPDTVRQIDAR